MGWSAFRPVGLTGHIVDRSYKGYTLFSPLRGDSTYLIDMDGLIVHRWHHADLILGYGRLLENGNLLLIANREGESDGDRYVAEDPEAPIEKRLRALGGNASLAREIDWDGDIVWEYENPAIHHDFLRLPNGNTMFPQWIELDEETERKVRGGRRDRKRNKPRMLGDIAIEVAPDGSTVREVGVSALLDPRRNSICPLERRIEWTHMNSIDVDESGRILFSCRNISLVGIISADDELEWTFAMPEISHQHNASWLPNGNVQIFDNGMHRHAMSRSSILEVNPESGEVEWRYVARPENQFFSGHISGAERQPNGNVLICEGTSGRLFEVARSGEVVWEWITPFTNTLGENVIPWIFRAHRYGPDHPAVAGRDLAPISALNRLHGLG